MWLVSLIMFTFAAIISYLWVSGIDNMRRNHPNYKGDDFLNWDKQNDLPDWDDNKTNTEGGF